LTLKGFADRFEHGTPGSRHGTNNDDAFGGYKEARCGDGLAHEVCGIPDDAISSRVSGVQEIH
jgi:hypothetical protein